MPCACRVTQPPEGACNSSFGASEHTGVRGETVGWTAYGHASRSCLADGTCAVAAKVCSQSQLAVSVAVACQVLPRPTAPIPDFTACCSPQLCQCCSQLAVSTTFYMRSAGCFVHHLFMSAAGCPTAHSSSLLHSRACSQLAKQAILALGAHGWPSLEMPCALTVAAFLMIVLAVCLQLPAASPVGRPCPK